MMSLKEIKISSDSQNKPKDQTFEENKENPVEKTRFTEKGIHFLRKQEMGYEGSESKPSKTGQSGSQELTLSYLCDNSGKNLLNSFDKVGSYKGKEVVSEDLNEENHRWVERDFLQLSDNNNNNNKGGNSSKREAQKYEEFDAETREKKPKLETLNLSLALPCVSLSLAASNPVQDNVSLPNCTREARMGIQTSAGPSDGPGMEADFLGRAGGGNHIPRSAPLPSLPSRSVQSLAPSNNNTQTTYSNDFTTASLSYSYSHPFSHNPSCSLTRNSTENYEYSVGSHRRDCDQAWNCGEGTNGSVHSRFRPVGDGVALSNHGGGVFSLMQGNHSIHKDNSLYPTTSSDNLSFFPSELPARPRLDTQSGDSRGRGSERLRDLESSDGGRARKLSRPERIVREIVSESIPLMSQIIQELADETVESIKEYLKTLIGTPQKKEDLVGLQNRLERRSDLTKETLSKSHRNQLEILVTIKMGLGSLLSSKNSVPTIELVEIFLLERCRNVNCRRILPVDDCDCKICSTKKGFCSECMCPVCFNFDYASNTCSWVGCDVCSHWCHAACGIQRNVIRPGPSLKGPSGTTEMQFHCLGCDHASEMFGFVKDVFMSCAKGWAFETLVKELDCVKKIFRRSEDFKGKELHVKADEMLAKLENKMMSPSDVCNFIFQFFNYTDGLSDFPSASVPSADPMATQATLKKDAASLPPSNALLAKSAFYDTSPSSGRQDLLPVDLHQNNIKVPLMNDKIIEDEWSVKPSKRGDGFNSLESMVRVKEAETRMFQNRADEARREAEGFRRMVRINSEKLEEEYSENLTKLCLQETEERRRKKQEELKILENSQCDYYEMKMRMQAEIAGLLKRMEVTKQQWV